MIRTILIFILLLLIYQSLRILFRSAARASREKGGRDERARLRGEDMVLDPECRTYVLKERAVTRSVRGTKLYFCSEACAQRHEERNRA